MPIKVIDKATQQEIDVSSDEAQYGVLQGRFVLPDASVRVARGNQTATIPADKLITALGQGGRLVDDEEADQVKLERDASSVGSQILGGLEATAAGATLGGSTYLEEALGADPKAMRARREGLGALGTGLELAGAVAPAIFTGGGSAAVQGTARAGAAARVGLGARALGATPAGGLARLGARAERGLGALLPEAAPGLVRQVVPVAGRGLVEGFGAGVGQEIDESVLGEREITAERLLAGGGMGALFGAGTGALIPGLAYAGQGLGRVAVKPVRGLLGKAAGYADELPSLDDGLSGLIASPRGRDTLATMWGVPRAEVDVWADMAPDIRNKLFGERVKLLEQAADETRPIFEGFRSTRKISIREGTGEGRMRLTRENMPTDRDALARISKEGQGQLEAIDGGIAQEAARKVQGLSRVDPVDMARTAAIVERTRKLIGEQAGKMAPREFAAHVHSTLDTAKRELDELRQGYFGRPLSISEQETAKFLDDTVTPLRSHLGDEKIYGAAGALHAERNRLMSQAIRSREQLAGASRNVVDVRKPLDNADLLTVMRNGGSWRGATKTEGLLDHVSAESDLLEWHLRHSDLDDTARKAMTEQLAANKALVKAVDARKKIVRAADVVDRWRGQQTNASPSDNLLTTAAPFAGGLIGGLIGGVPGALIGGAIGMATKPYNMARMLSVIDARAKGAQQETIKALSGALRKLGSGAKTAAKAAGAGVAAGTRAIGETLPRAAGTLGGDRRARAETIRSTAARLAANPGLLATEQRKMTQDLEDTAPLLSKALAAKTAIAVQFLASKAPSSYSPPMSKGPPMVDPIALAEYERYVEAVIDPIATLRRIGQGTFTAEHAEALKAVWPAKYDEAQRMIFEAIAARNGEPMDLQIATQLSTLWDAPVDPTLECAGGISLAFAGAPPQPQAPPQGGKPSKPPKLEIDSSVYSTPMDAATKASST